MSGYPAGRVLVLYPDGHIGIPASDGILRFVPIIDNTETFKISTRVGGSFTNNCKTQDLVLFDIEFETIDQAEIFCKKTLELTQNLQGHLYLKGLQSEILLSGEIDL